MQRRLASVTLAAAFLLVAFAAITPTASPVRLARHPDYHAGTIAFSYLGDIWTASEDGSRTRRLTDHRAREVYPRFSPDGRLDRVLVEPLRQLRRVRGAGRPAERRSV